MSDHLFIDHPPNLFLVFGEVHGFLRITLGLHPQFSEEAEIAFVTLDGLFIKCPILEERPRRQGQLETHPELGQRIIEVLSDFLVGIYAVASPIISSLGDKDASELFDILLVLHTSENRP